MTFQKRLYHESGLQSVYLTGLDAWLIILCRSCRMFAYGSVSLILALFFAELHVSDQQIGLFMTLTLVGDVVLSLLVTLVADRMGRRRTLLVGSVMMIASGTTFALCENYWILLLAAVVGVISATGSDFGPFRAIEESTMSELTSADTRPDVFSWYVTTASLGSSLGFEVTGRFVEWLRAKDGWTLLDAYHACFWVYVVIGSVSLFCNLFLSKNCELKKPKPVDSVEAEPMIQDEDELGRTRSSASSHNEKSSRSRWLIRISPETRSVILALWFLLMVDSLADGMVSMTLTTYYIDQKFHVSKSTLGDVLSASYFLATCSTVFAGPLSRHIGLVSTMVFTHIPSSAAVLLFSFSNSIPLTFALLLLRIGLNNMDQAPRAALIAAVVKPEERTAVMGITSLLRTLASTIGPSVTGILAGNDKFWIAFVVAGTLRLAYDFGLFAMFIDFKLNKHEPGVGTSESMNLEHRETVDEEVDLDSVSETSSERN